MKVICVIPTYRAKDTVASIAKKSLDYVDEVIVVDDACPEGSGSSADGLDKRITVVYRDKNGGVGAATKTGITLALDCQADVIVKLDADGQMEPSLIPDLISPLISGWSDMTKGTRFDSPEDLEGMPKGRLLGNSALTLINKFTTGYWSLNDPTNGFIAITKQLANELKWEKVSDDYFFESDLLFRARLVGAIISQMRMRSTYKNEHSDLKPLKVVFPFLAKHAKNQIKRLLYLYFVREWNLGTIYLLSAGGAFLVGVVASFLAIEQSSFGNVGTGTAVLASLGFILWVQFVSQFLAIDVTSEPKSSSGNRRLS